jgi:glycosyltransferase involved in cell wall biosynthesis
MSARPTRVLHCEGNLDGTVGGSYFSLLYLASGLDKRRFDPLIVFHRPNPLEAAFRDAGLPTQVIPAPGTFNLPGGSVPVVGWLSGFAQKAINSGRFLRQAWRCRAILRRERIDLLHLNNSLNRSHAWMIGARLAGVPCVVHERGINHRFPRIVRLLAPKVDAVICISQAVRDNLVTCGITSHNLHVIPNGLDPARVVPGRDPAAVRAAIGAGPDQPIIGLVGNIKEWKGQDVLVQALPAILARVPDLRCVFVGDTAASDKPYEDRVRRLADELGVASSIFFAGYQKDVAGFVNVMDVAIHASVAPEPFGRVLLEAMALRKPVVGSRSGAVPEIVVHDQTGFTFEPGNPKALAEAVVTLLTDRPRAVRMGDAGYARLESTFHIRLNVERTMTLFDALVGRGPRPGTG